MVIAADFPFMDLFWTMLIFFSWVIWIWMMVVILTDVFRRRDLSGWAKAGWTVFLIVLPFLGALIYLISQHDGMAERTEQRAMAARGAADDHARAVAGNGGPAAEIERAKHLLDSGAIDQREYQAIKHKAIA